MNDLMITPDTTNPWDPRLILDLALGIDDIPEILSRYNLSEDEFNILSSTAPFRQELAITIREAREHGIKFSQKAKVQAEGYLEVLDSMVYDQATPASVRLEAIRSTVKWGRLEPPKEKTEGDTNAQQINVNINF